MRISLTLAALLAALLAAGPSRAEDEDSITIRMPSAKPKMHDSYFCTGLKLPDEPIQVIGYQPLAKMDTAHHMLLYSCSEPGNVVPIWNCGEMGGGAGGDALPTGSTCASGFSLIYAWAMNAPELRLPPEVGFKLRAGDTLVLQVHYNKVDKFLNSDLTDDSGIKLLTTKAALPKSAAVYLLGTGGSVPKHQVTYLEAACKIDSKKKMHPFAFRTHTHKHGRVVSAYRVRDDKWTEVGRGNPRRPQMFYPITGPEGIALTKGDIVAARCTMYNRHNHDVHVGSTGADEMCNFYMMFWVEGDVPEGASSCWSNGFPYWDWSRFGKGLNAEKGAPLEASVQPKLGLGEEEVVEDAREAADGASGLLAEVDPRFVIQTKDGGRFYMNDKVRRAFGWK